MREPRRRVPVHADKMTMDFTPASLVVALVASSVGLAMFLYGKKQARPPQAIAGIVLMILPVVFPGALWGGISSAIVIGGLWIAVRAGL